MSGERDHFWIFGHRGSPRRQRENTVESFEQALREGADGFETDLRILSDGVSILHHDDEIRGDPVESLSSVELVRRGGRLQPLRDLARFAGKTRMVLEVKRAGWEEQLIAEVGGWPDIVVASFDHALIRELARRKVSFPLGVTFSGVIIDLPAYAKKAGATWCFPDHRHVSEELVRDLHQSGIVVVPWTANHQRDWKRLRAAGCDGVITDDPAGAVAWRAQTR